MALRSPSSSSFSSSSSSSSFSYGFSYDVFLSFRGTDTRHRFTGYLYEALRRSGIYAFIDDRELDGGDEITPTLKKAIEESRIAIPVFSKNYASSSFCLDELVHIIQCVKAKGRLVLPVFYEVDPSQVRHHNTGSYAEALTKHEERFNNNSERYTENMERLQKWKMALKQAANLSGQHFILGNGYEYEFIGKIVKEVSNKINRVPLYVADYPVGLESRVLQVKSLLGVGLDDEVRMVGIYGMGGKGKSTLARAIYNSIADQFEGLCFLDDVREKSVKHGLVYLQETLLCETIGEKDIKLGSVSKGIPIIKQRLHQKKVLLILDDVDELKQLKIMAGGLDWFGPGSRVIITTRDKHLLASHRVERTHEVDQLNEEDALELLRWNAFENNRVDSNYECMLNRAVTYASGLPLALEVVGSSLFGKNIEEWKSLLDQYEKIPNEDIQKTLEVSFNALGEEEKRVFLDISCCVKGYRLAEVEDILHAHYDRCMKYHIGVLVEKSLIKISQCDYVTLHDLIEAMGKEIVRHKSEGNLGKCSRLWFHEDIIQVLEEDLGTSQIVFIHLDCPSSKEEEIEWKGDELMKMKELKTLIIVNGPFSKGPEQLPNSLRVLEWRRYPSKSLPSGFRPRKLSICKLQESQFESLEFHGSLKRFTSITNLNFDNCQWLKRIHDVSSLQNLKKFSFVNCENLISIHDSVGFLSKLEILHADKCIRLGSFPPIELTSLQSLGLEGCSSLGSFPEVLSEMGNVPKIDLMGTSIKELPLSFQKLTGLRLLTCEGNEIKLFEFLSIISMMPKLLSFEALKYPVLPEQNDKLFSTVSLKLRYHCSFPHCNVSDGILPKVLKWLANVRELDLSNNNFTILPECIKECQFLSGLRLEFCECLREIRGVPPKLKHLSAFGCKSLISSCRSMLLKQELHEAGSTEFCFPGTARIPDWFEHQNRGWSISFWFRNKIPSIALIVVNETNKGLVLETCLSINGHQIDLDDPGESVLLSSMAINSVYSNHTHLYDLRLPDRVEEEDMDKALLKNEWNHVEITFQEDQMFPKVESTYSKRMIEFRRVTTFENDGDQEENSDQEEFLWMMSPLIKSGIHVFKERSIMEDIQFTNPYQKRKLDDDDDHYSQW